MSSRFGVKKNTAYAKGLNQLKGGEMKPSEIVVFVGDSLSGLVDGICSRPVDRFTEANVDKETSLVGAIYSMYSSMLKRGVRWTKARITMRIDDSLCNDRHADG